MNYNIINGNSAEVLKTYPDNYFDSVVCDPPYGINFLGKDWDKDTGEEEVYRQCFRVLKPGGYLLAFSAARTYHHLALAVERSGFEIRDQIMWVYGSGFPKSQDVGRQIQKHLGVEETERVTVVDKRCNGYMDKKGLVDLDRPIATSPLAQRWSGWGNALKPSHEPIVMAQKPFKGALYKQVLENGIGALNIDGCRVGEGDTLGRFPANLIHDGSDEVVELFPHSTSGARKSTYKIKGLDGSSEREMWGSEASSGKYRVQPFDDHPAESGSAARFFYCAKVSKRERNIGHEDDDTNSHPTVKPVALMRYLIKLVTPPRGHVLDPFNGSGSTGMAAVELGHEYTGIELDPKYCEIARKRIEAWNNNKLPDCFEE